MCLTIVEKRFNKTSPRYQEVTKVWKAFETSTSYGKTTLIGPYYDHIGKDGPRLTKGKWLKAHRVPVWADFKDKYMSGFHAFLNEQDCRDRFRGYTHTILQVKVRGVRYVGTEDGLPVVVADEMYIPRGKK